MTSVVTERPVQYEPPSSPMNSIGEGATPLMYACQQGRDEEVKTILSKKPAAVRERDRTMKTALHYCAENLAVSCAELVLAAAPDLVDARDEDGYTPLHLAVIAGNRQLTKFLLAKNADVNCLDYERHSVVHWATVCGEVEALEIVLDAGANPSTPDIHGGYPIHYAAQMCGPNSEMGNDVRFGLAVLRKLLARGVEVNVRDKDGRQPILWAASAGSADAILALVNAGANVEADDKDGLTALHCAASRGHTDCLETLVTLCGAEVDVIDSNGCTALFYSVTLGHADSTQLLMSFGAEPNRQDRKGRTPAHCGAAKGQLETLRILGAHGANLWVRNVRGDYPLHEAVVSGRKDLVRWLLSQRPDAVNSPNNDGRCPIHIAAINNNVEMCKILLDGQALLNPVMRTSKGHMMTPIDAALHRGNRGCAKYLQLHGGVPASKLTDKAARLRGGTQRGAMSETQSEQYTTPEYTATLSLPGGHTSLGTSPLGDHESRRIDNRTLQAYESKMLYWQDHIPLTRWSEFQDGVRLNDDVAIRHVERIDAPVFCTHRRYNDESSGEERMRRRRRRRRREHYHTDEEDSRRHKKGGRSDSVDSEVRKRRRRRRDEEEFSDSGSERRTRRRWRSRRHSSDDDDEEVAKDSNWIKNKKRRNEKYKRRSRSKEESEDGSDIEYIRIRRAVKTKKTRRKIISDEELEEKTQSEEDTEEVSDEVEEVVEDAKESSEEALKQVKEEVVKKTKASKVESSISPKRKLKQADTQKIKPKVEAKSVTKAESQKRMKKQVSVDKDTKKKQQVTDTKKAEAENKSDRSKSRISKKTVMKEKSTTKKTTEETKDNSKTKSATKKVVKRGIKKVETTEAPTVVDKVLEKEVVEQVSLNEENDATQTVVTAEVHQQQEEASTEARSDTVEESAKEDAEKLLDENKEQQSATENQGKEEKDRENQQETSEGVTENEEQTDEVQKEEEKTEEEKTEEEKTEEGQGEKDNDTESPEVTAAESEVQKESEENDDKVETGVAESEEKITDLFGEKVHNAQDGDGEFEKEETKIKSEEGEEKSEEDKEGSKPEEDETKLEEDQPKPEEEMSKLENEESKHEESKHEDERKMEEGGEMLGNGEALAEDNVETGKEEVPQDELKTEGREGVGGEEEESREGEDDEAGRREEKETEEKESEEKTEFETNPEDNEEGKPEIKEAESKPEEKAELEADGGDDDTRSDDKARSEQVEGPPTDDEAQELEHDSITASSPLEKEEVPGNVESGASTARSRNGGDSSVLLDSGFEPSPRRDKSSTTSSKQQAHSAHGSTRGGRGRGRIPRPCRTDDEQPITTVSVTQAVQNSMRKYHLERRIFQELLELKRLQIRAGRANEQVLVKRLVDDYHKAGLTVGMRQYDGVYTFRNFEKYLYDQLRLLQSSDRRLIPRLKSSDDLEKLTAALKRARFNSAYMEDVPDNPILCTHGTHRCHHATHAYTGIPCAAYISKLNHHNIPKSSGGPRRAGTAKGFLPRIDSSTSTRGHSSSTVPRSLRYVDPSRPVTLELSHGSDKQVISLPTERLDRNKRYYVTFTIKGGSKDDQKVDDQDEEKKGLRHRHAKSL